MIRLDHTGKKYIRDWIFRDLSFVFETGGCYAVTGGNGSGKSTLMQCIAGLESIQKGQIAYTLEAKALSRENVYRHLSLCAPYVDLLDEYTLEEAIRFHFKFRNPLPGLDLAKILELSELEKHRNKQLQYYSSGMRQRVKLLLSICTEGHWLLLDEPCTNLDQKGNNWYLEMINTYRQGRTVIVASNQPAEYSFCTEILNIEAYKG